MIGILKDMALALQFLTRVPIRFNGLDPARLGRAAAWFPAVGLVVGGLAVCGYALIRPHLGSPLAALTAVLITAMVTGGLHDDGLADCADAFGGGWTREDQLRILKDSRIGSFGGLALIFSVTSRILLLSAMPPGMVLKYIVSAHVIARCTPLPLSALLKPAREHEGQGRRVAGAISWSIVAFGIAFTVAVAIAILHVAAWQPIVVATVVTAITGVFYQRQLGGITGDCMGATIQISEIAVYVCGAWVR